MSCVLRILIAVTVVGLPSLLPAQDTLTTEDVSRLRNQTDVFASKINDEFRGDATPDNNFFAAIFPYSTIPEAEHVEDGWVATVCRELGCERPWNEPLKLRDFAPWDFSDQKEYENLCAEEDKALSHSFKRGEFPRVDRAIDDNSQMINAILAAAERSHSFRPLVPPGDGLLIDCRFPDWAVATQVVRLTLMRANRFMGEDNWEDAERDLLATNRLVSHLGQIPLLKYIGYASDDFCQLQSSHIWLLSMKRVSPERKESFVRKIGSVRPFLALSRCVDKSERWINVESVQRALQGKMPSHLQIPGYAESIAKAIQKDVFHPEDVIRGVHGVFDRRVRCLSDKNIRQQMAFLEEEEAEDEQLKAGVKRATEIAESFLGESTTPEQGPFRYLAMTNLNADGTPNIPLRGYKLGEIFARILRPNFHDVLYYQYECQRAMLPAALAAIVHHEKTAVWPNNSEGLTWLDGTAVPRDPLNGLPFQFRVLDEGVVIRGLGINREDDSSYGYGGFYVSDPKSPEEKAADDVALRLTYVNVAELYASRERSRKWIDFGFRLLGITMVCGSMVGGVAFAVLVFRWRMFIGRWLCGFRKQTLNGQEDRDSSGRSSIPAKDRGVD